MNRFVILIILVVQYTFSIAQSDSVVVEKKYKVFTYPNGNIASEGYLKDGKPTGYWKSYFISGIKKSEGNWKNNTLDSVWIFYDQLGDTIEKINYYQGKKNGFYYKYFTSDQNKNKVAFRELFVNGNRNNESIFYYPSGEIKKKIPFVNNKKHGLGFEYDENGNVISITRYRKDEIIVEEKINRYNEKGKKEGVWKEFYSSGNVKKERNYKNGNLDGYVKRYNEDGKLINSIKYKNGDVDLSDNDFESEIELKEEYNEEGNVTFQGSFKNNIPVGIHRYFNNDGKVIESKTFDIDGNLIAKGIILPNGWEEGKWIYYFLNGKKKAVGTYTRGNKTGKWIYYYPNGKVQQSGSYVSGKFSGTWRWFYETGELLKEESYIYGQLDGQSTEYSIMNNIIAKGNYIEGRREGNWIYVVGDQKYTGNYSSDQKDGIWKSYYLQEESLSFRGNYLQGNPDGKHVYYYPNGKILKEEYYSEGQKVKAWSKYNENGELVIVIQFKDGEVYKINGERVELNQNDN